MTAPLRGLFWKLRELLWNPSYSRRNAPEQLLDDVTPTDFAETRVRARSETRVPTS